jgi:hypothetical protein
LVKFCQAKPLNLQETKRIPDFRANFCTLRATFCEQIQTFKLTVMNLQDKCAQPNRTATMIMRSSILKFGCMALALVLTSCSEKQDGTPDMGSVTTEANPLGGVSGQPKQPTQQRGGNGQIPKVITSPTDGETPIDDSFTAAITTIATSVRSGE